MQLKGLEDMDGEDMEDYIAWLEMMQEIRYEMAKREEEDDDEAKKNSTDV